jgi:hypothetical protein
LIFLASLVFSCLALLSLTSNASLSHQVDTLTADLEVAAKSMIVLEADLTEAKSTHATITTAYDLSVEMVLKQKGLLDTLTAELKEEV